MAAKKILIVDSDAASRNFIARQLQEQNYEVLQAGSGKEGLISAWRDRPDLIIAEPVLADLKGEELAHKLRQDARTAAVPLIALSSDASVARIRSSQDAGFNEYIVKSGEAITALNEAVGRLLGLSAGGAREGGLLIVFLSAKGGTGVSSLCANFAMTIAHSQPEARVAVADLVLPIGSVAPIVGYTGETNIVTASDMSPQETTVDFFHKYLTELSEWKFHLLAGSPDPESSNHLKSERIWDIISTLRAGYEYVLVDLGRSLSRISLPLIQNADLSVLIVSADLSAVMLTKTLWEYLKNKGIQPNSVYPILNRAVGIEGLTKPEAEKILDFEIKTAMPYLGSNFTVANNQHLPFSLKFPKDTAAIVFKETTRAMVDLARRLRTSV
ncbi:MAG: response regulator [Chloroflexota bacterium]